MTVIIGWAEFDAAHPPVDINIGFIEFDTQAAPQVAAAASVYGHGGARPSYHSDHEDFAPRQYRIRVHAENDEEEQIVLNLIMEFARHVL